MTFISHWSRSVALARDGERGAGEYCWLFPSTFQVTLLKVFIQAKIPSLSLSFKINLFSLFSSEIYFGLRVCITLYFRW